MIGSNYNGNLWKLQSHDEVIRVNDHDESSQPVRPNMAVPDSYKTSSSSSSGSSRENYNIRSINDPDAEDNCLEFWTLELLDTLLRILEYIEKITIAHSKTTQERAFDNNVKS